ncbi:MAG: hypothetical protein A2Z16_02670 [Chloroflexi bacterium RBG_16_54_18]|nr:MAG: hypothetical protein A2Z16_02670 [Chloroflexi bacterium RBG_16_54_18]
MPHRKSVYQQVKEQLKPAFLAVLLAGILWVPLLEFTPLSTRAQLEVQDNLTYSLPFQRLFGLLFPDLGGFHEWVVYSGAVVFLLSLLAILALRREYMSNFWIALLLGSLLFATLTQLELFQFLARLPGMSLLRVPSRSLFLFGMSLAALSACAVDRLLGDNDWQSLQNSRRLILGLCGFVGILLAGLRLVSGNLPLEFLWGGLLLLAGCLWVWLRMNQRISGFLWFAVLMGLCLLDWGVMDRSLFTMRSRSEVLEEGEQVAAEFSGTPGEYRIYSPSYSLPQQTAALHSLQLADGVDPLQLRAYVDFMERASGVPVNGYSVTLPPFESGEPHSENATFSPNAGLLGWLNVRYVASDFDLHSEGLVLRKLVGGTRLYENQQVMPRLWIQPLETATGDNFQPLNAVQWSPERIEVDAAGPGLLVLSEVMYPGWRVQVDGSPATILKAAGLLRSVNLPAGSHNVVFYFRPVSLYVGASLSLAGLVLACLLYRRFTRNA